MFRVISHFLFIMKWNMKSIPFLHDFFCASWDKHQQGLSKNKSFAWNFTNNIIIWRHALENTLPMFLNYKHEGFFLESGNEWKFTTGMFSLSALRWCGWTMWEKSGTFSSFHQVTCFVTKVIVTIRRCCICWDCCFILNMKIVENVMKTLP